MPIIQVAYDVPPEIYEGLISGSLTRFGSVVRNSTHITTHLKEVPLVKEEFEAGKVQMAKAAESASTGIQKAGKTIVEVAKKNKYTLIGIGALVAVGAAYGIYTLVDNHNKQKAEESKLEGCAKRFNNALNIYIDAIKAGNLQIHVLDDLIDSLDEIEAKCGDREATVEISTSQLSALLFVLSDYTQKLAAANDISLEGFDVENDSSLISLRPYLEKQREIMRAVA